MAEEEKASQQFETRNQRAIRDTRSAPHGYWYGLIGVDAVLSITFAVAGAATPQNVDFWERAVAGLLSAGIALIAGAIILVGATYLWQWWHAPMRLLRETRSTLLELMTATDDIRDLSDLIRRLKDSQLTALNFLGDMLTAERQPTDEAFMSWNFTLASLMEEAGDEHYARYTRRVAHDSMPRSPTTATPMDTVYKAMIDVLTDTIADLSARRERLRSEARAKVSSPQ